MLSIFQGIVLSKNKKQAKPEGPAAVPIPTFVNTILKNYLLKLEPKF